MLFIGCAGWSIPGPSKSRFPEGGSHLERYAQVFACTEINSSFYRSHRAATWARWAQAVPAHFRFSVKAPRSITHDHGLQGPPELLSAFLNEARGLGDKLGAILFQTPPKLELDEPVAGGLFESLRSRYEGQVAIEPRHASWFTKSANRLLRGFDIARVAADPAPHPEGAHPGGSARFTYYRWHGSPRKYYSAYSQQRLIALANSLQSQSQGAAWCIFDNTASGAATENALSLRDLSAKANGSRFS